MHEEKHIRNQEYFNRRVNAFIEYYASRGHEGRDFEHELRGIIMDAMRIAQEPFVYELNLYRENTIKSSMIKP